MFTYTPPAADGEVVQEADLKILTNDPEYSIQYTNQSGSNAGATRNVSDPDQVNWRDWQYHRIDWNPGSSTWYINRRLMSSIAFQVPRDPSLIIFITWSDGGSWSENMRVGDEFYLQIQWIELIYNTAQQ